MATANGSLVQQKKYYPYGNGRGGGDFAVDFNYTGQRKDGTGLLYYNARYYDPQLGQFLSPDSIIPDPTDYFSFNRYVYRRGNPISHNDPSGHKSIQCCSTGLPSPWVQLSSASLRSDQAQAIGQAFGFVWCSMTACDILDIAQQEFQSLAENYIQPHLPAEVIQFGEVTNAILETPGVMDALLATMRMPSTLLAGENGSIVICRPGSGLII
jgi:RHS repeat-associated protein